MEIVAKQSIQPELPLAQWLLGPWLIQLEKIMANAASIAAIRLGAVITTMAGGAMFIMPGATVARRDYSWDSKIMRTDLQSVRKTKPPHLRDPRFE